MSFNSGANANLVQTRLDSLAKEEFDYPASPGEVESTDTLFFKQESFDKGSYTHEEIAGPGQVNEINEEQDVEEASPVSGNLVTSRILKYAKDIPIPDEMMEDAQLGVVEYQTRLLARNIRLASTDHAFRRSYGDAFGGANTPDGADLCSNSHTALSGDTVDNLETGALSSANLEIVVRSLRRHRAQDGTLGGHTADGLLVALNLHKSAYEITASELEANTSDNQKNYFSNVYPLMKVGTSAFLHSDYNNLNTNVNTSYFVVGRFHQITRIARKSLQTKLVPPDTDRKDRWFYRAKFREVVIPKSWTGLVGSNGTA